MFFHKFHDLANQVKGSVNLIQILKIVGDLFHTRKKIREDRRHHFVECLVLNYLLIYSFSLVFYKG